jgi:hypothetical protein
MVRLVFRPYTRVRRSICTSESLRASTRVSSGFALLGHSSPSFGSQPARCRSTFGLRGAFPAGARCGGFRPEPPLPAGTVTLIARAGLRTSLALARRLDSLVRVSRRGEGSARLPPGPGRGPGVPSRAADRIALRLAGLRGAAATAGRVPRRAGDAAAARGPPRGSPGAARSPSSNQQFQGL